VSSPVSAWAIHKTVLHRAGIFSSDYVREPAKSLDEITRLELKELTDALPLAVLEKQA
jgi:4-hydroxy-tetrahydrodipicolinate synthase